MGLLIPPHIASADVDRPSLRYRWDDWTADAEEGYDSTWVVKGLAGATWRARCVVGVGVYEWILYRFQSLSQDPVPWQLLEGLWAASVERTHLDYTEFDRDEWAGPIRGPLWCAMTWVQPMVVAREDDIDVEAGLAYLPRLAVHVLPEPLRFEAWLRETIERACRYHPMMPEDPLDDLFGEMIEDRRGPLVARELLDPMFAYDPKLAPELTRSMLQALDFQSNPFLLEAPVPEP